MLNYVHFYIGTPTTIDTAKILRLIKPTLSASLPPGNCKGQVVSSLTHPKKQPKSDQRQCAMSPTYVLPKVSNARIYAENRRHYYGNAFAQQKVVMVASISTCALGLAALRLATVTVESVVSSHERRSGKTTRSLRAQLPTAWRGVICLTTTFAPSCTCYCCSCSSASLPPTAS